jgi:transposase InsO family protein
MHNDIKLIINDCAACIQHTVVKDGYHPSRPIRASLPGEHWQMDFAKMALPKTADGMCDLLVIVDVFTGFILLAPLQNATAELVAKALWRIFSIMGPPVVLQSDNDPAFTGAVVNSLCRLLGIEQRMITAYHPEADGKVENIIGTVKSTLAKILRGYDTMWPCYVPGTQMAYNDKITRLTGSSPYSLMFGKLMNVFRDYNQEHQPVITRETEEHLLKWKEHQDKILSLIYPAISVRFNFEHSIWSKFDFSPPDCNAATSNSEQFLASTSSPL